MLMAVAALGLLVWALWPRPAPTATSAPADTKEALQAVEPGASPASPTGTAMPTAHAVPRRVSAERQQLRNRVVDTLRAREASRGEAHPSAQPGTEAKTHPDGTMADRTGYLGKEVKILNHELMPLIDECFDQAAERNPRLHGMLAVGVKFASAEGVGSIIEDVVPEARNELPDPELIDCVRQSAFTIQLPMPIEDQRSAVMLTIPFGSDAGPAGPEGAKRNP